VPPATSATLSLKRSSGVIEGLDASTSSISSFISF
jgi:hypothetical protein